MTLLIRQGLIRTNDATGTVLERGDILVVGDRIAAIGPDLSAEAAKHPGAEVIEAKDRIVLPGFVDAHMHSNEGFEMGRYDNLPLEIWLSEVYPPFGAPVLSWREHYLRAMLVGIVESLTSTFYGPSWAPAVAFGFLLLTLAVRPAGLLGR